MAIILGIDPGFASLGWCIIDLSPSYAKWVDCGVIKTKKEEKRAGVLASDDNLVRARLIYKGLANKITHYEVRAVVAESMSYPRNASAASKMAIAWGVIAALTEQYRLPLVQASPQKVKKLVAGKTTATKEEVEASVIEQLVNPSDEIKTKFPSGDHEHIFDSIAVVLACQDSEVLRLVRSTS